MILRFQYRRNFGTTSDNKNHLNQMKPERKKNHLNGTKQNKTKPRIPTHFNSRYRYRYNFEYKRYMLHLFL